MESIYARFPRLETERLILRDIRPTDAEAVYRIFSDDRVTRYYDLDTFTEHRQAEELIDRFNHRYLKQIGIRWGIALQRAPDLLIGTAGYNAWFQQSRRAILGYDLNRGHWRQGIMSEALRAVLRCGFERMELNRIEALIFASNAASRGLLTKLGFDAEGILREYEYLHGRFVDMALHALLKRDYAAQD